MAKAPAFQFYPADYMRDTRMLSLQARGAWADLLCVMWFSEERGKCNGDVTQMKRLWGVENDTAKAVLDELISCKICDVETDCNGNVTLVNRRMVRDEKERNLIKLRVKRFREKEDVTDKKRKRNGVSSSSSSSSSSYKRIKTYSSDAPAYRLSAFLFDSILSCNPESRLHAFENGKKESTIQNWAKDIDLLLRIDHREPSTVEEVITFATHDDFWRANILSGKKLRDKWDTLVLQKGRLNAKKEDKWNDD